MRDKMLIYSNFEDLRKKCEACLKRDHDIFNCPQIHYVPRKNFIITRHQYSKPRLERELFKRTTRKSAKALRVLKLFNEKFLRLESSAMRNSQNNNNEEGSNHEFSEDELKEQPDSPRSSILRKSASKDFRASLVLKSMNDDSFQKTVEDEKEGSFEDEPGSKEETKKRKRKENVGDSNNSLNHRQIPNSEREKMTIVTQETSKEPEWHLNFENMHLFSNYFVGNNADVVIMKYEKYMAKRAALLQKQRNRKKRTISQFSKQKSLVSASLKKTREQISSKGIHEKYEVHDDLKSPKKENLE